MTVEEIVGEPLRIFGRARGAALRAQVQALLAQVGLDPQFVRRYPHEFSGGQRQRIGIARALALKPDLIVCDEPISALDVSIRAQILNLLLELQREHALTYVLIAHDIAAVRHVADRIAVMYLGRIVELGDAVSLCSAPAHPYTRALIAAVPLPDPRAERERARRRLPLLGEPPSPIAPPSGCHFHPRCPDAIERCRVESPRCGSCATAALRPATSPERDARGHRCARRDGRQRSRSAIGEAMSHRSFEIFSIDSTNHRSISRFVVQMKPLDRLSTHRDRVNEPPQCKSHGLVRLCSAHPIRFAS